MKDTEMVRALRYFRKTSFVFICSQHQRHPQFKLHGEWKNAAATSPHTPLKLVRTVTQLPHNSSLGVLKLAMAASRRHHPQPLHRPGLLTLVRYIWGQQRWVWEDFLHNGQYHVSLMKVELAETGCFVGETCSCFYPISDWLWTILAFTGHS